MMFKLINNLQVFILHSILLQPNIQFFLLLFQLVHILLNIYI